MLNVLSTLFRATAMSNTKKWSAEFLGTFWLTLGGRGRGAGGGISARIACWVYRWPSA
jgi:glycerol uptake facilitator-like aquaporin